MPLVRRSVYPTDLCRKQLPENGVNELEMVTNNTLAGVITQLSGIGYILSFSFHSNIIFLFSLNLNKYYICKGFTQKILKKKIKNTPMLIMFRIVQGFQKYIWLVCQTSLEMGIIF